ncbi:MAG: Zn-dependent oligopeptidase [Flavobacteriales bacterium]|jgi:Zn-dependent oligopeptidase|tara:strand:- start:4985 stop:7012 length:2028 start_codon:yes stop_codon:yes gene_type:complete
MSEQNNPLLIPFDLAPFSKVKNEHFLPAFKVLIKEAKEEIEAIANNTAAPTFENTIEDMEFSGNQLDRVSSLFFNLNSAETNDEIQEIAQEVSPLLTEFGNDVTLNPVLFQRVKSVYDTLADLDLTPEQTTLLENSYKGFSRNGANLNEVDKKTLREIDTKLSKLKLTYGENLLAETNGYELHLTTERDLAGLPDGVKEAAAQTAKSQGTEGWVFTLHHPSYGPFMKYADDRELRMKMAIAFGARGFQDNSFSNKEITLQITKLRHQRANLLGYTTHSHFVLEERMATSPEKVNQFLGEMLEKAKPFAQKEFDELAQFAKDLDGITEFQKWDSSYYAEKLKKKLFNLDDEQLKPYFKLENVIEGAFTVANKLFGLTFKKVSNIDKYHQEVETYEVYDAKENLVSIFYGDYFPREGKRNGAWMTSFKSQQNKDGKNERPHISNVCNFTKPTDTKPSLLTFDEVTTLFHEFGHGLHGMLANTTYPSLSGTSVYWDFVELPSQILENWCYEKECLDLFAKHYETGETIPMEFVEKIKESANFMEGLATLRQVSFGLLDMSWHGIDPSDITDVKAHERETFDKTAFTPDVAENCMSVAFSHIFNGGYSSGYYSYKWAEVLDADAFAFFKEQGIFNPAIGASFALNILSKGGTEHPMKLYKRFRGQEPNPDALLERAGLK